MDKEIIIDGVDISECSYAITPKRQCPNKPMPYAKETSCIGCKEHNTKLNFCKNNPDCYYKQLKRLQEENERLKEENKELKSSLVRQASTIFTLEKSSNDLSQCANKLYKALQEIRDIVSKIIDSYIRPYGDYDNLKKILTKINEVIGAE